MLHRPGQPSVVNTNLFLILQPIYEVKRHGHHQFLTCLKLVSIIFEQLWMSCSNGGIALFIFIHHTLNNKWPFIWFWASSFNIPQCHQLNVILFKLLWWCRFFFLYHITRVICFEIIFEVIVSIDSISSSSRFVINGWHCRHCGQGILNWSGHTIVDDEFLFVQDGLIRLWEHRIRGSHSPIHMISDSWTIQKENDLRFVQNTFIISIHGLIYFHQNTFVVFLVTKDAISLKFHQWFYLECIDLILKKSLR